jgi:pimeloyl-ACP methyl ester carboxylesterase
MTPDAAAWEAAGERVDCGDRQVWCARISGRTDAGNPPILILHGFPSCSFDWASTLGTLAAERDVLVVDCCGFGLSSKPDQRYGIRGYADEAEAAMDHFGNPDVDLVTHDMGDTVGGELLARSLEGSLRFDVRRRVVTNGSIYIDMAQLSIGQQLLLGLPDERNDAVGADGGEAFRSGLVGTFAGDVEPAWWGDDERRHLDSVVAMSARDGGLSLLPRTIRYIEDRRAEESRFTGAIETHPSPVALVWGREDPIAVHAMTDHFLSRRPGTARTTLDGVGHYPMLEAPEAFAAAIVAHLDQPA